MSTGQDQPVLESGLLEAETFEYFSRVQFGGPLQIGLVIRVSQPLEFERIDLDQITIDTDRLRIG